MDTGILIKIRQGQETFTLSEKKIGKFILDNPNEVLNYSIKKLAEKCDISEPTIIRFCRTLNLQGYKELKLAISADISLDRQNKRLIDDNFRADDSVEEILDKISFGSIKAIEDTRKIINEEALGDAIELINKAKCIYLFGVGASSVVCLDAQYKFARINIPTTFHIDVHMQLTSCVHMTKDDVAIAISNSGKTKDVVDALTIAKEKGTKTIAITQYGQSPILEVADIKLFTAHVENNFRSGAMTSRIAQLSIVDSLFIGVACKRYDKVTEQLRITRELLDKQKY